MVDSGEERDAASPERSRDTRLALYVGVAALAYYLLILGGHQYSIDGIAMFQSAKALVFQHSWKLDPPIVWGRASVRVSGWPLGMTLAYVPLLLAWYPVFASFPGWRATPYNPSVPFNPALYSNPAYLLCSILNPLITAATACLVFRAGRLLGLRRDLAVLAGLAYAFGSPAAAYARYDFAQPLATLTLIAAICGVLRTDATTRRAPLICTGLALGYGFITRVEFVLLAPWIIGWAYVRSRRVGVRNAALHAVLLAGSVALAVGVHLWVNWLKFGDPAQFREIRVSSLFPGAPSGIAEGLAGLLASPAHGILFFFPLTWLVVPGLRALGRARTGASTVFAGLMATLLAFYASFQYWWGGWCWGPRFLLPAVPLIALAAAAWVGVATPATPSWRPTVFALLAALGALISWNGIFTDPVQHTAWVHQRLHLPQTSASQFHVAASPLATGWPRGGRVIDVVWARVAFGRLSPSARWRSAGVLVPLGLAGVIAWAGRRLLGELNAPGSSVRRPDS